MFHELGYLQMEHLVVFPGKVRSEHAIALVEPLVELTREIYGGHEEHQKIFDGIREMFGIVRHPSRASST